MKSSDNNQSFFFVFNSTHLLLGMQEVQLKDLTFIPFLNEDTIQNRVREMATEINEKLKGSEPIFICILNGSFLFATDLFRQITIKDAEISFVKMASYSGTTSSGRVLTLLGLDVELFNRTVVIVEDIIDTGTTMSDFLPQLVKKGPKQIFITSLLTKPTALKHHLDIDQVGFEIEDKFVVGYGLDYNGLGRNLNAIYQLKESE